MFSVNISSMGIEAGKGESPRHRHSPLRPFPGRADGLWEEGALYIGVEIRGLSGLSASRPEKLLNPPKGETPKAEGETQPAKKPTAGISDLNANTSAAEPTEDQIAAMAKDEYLRYLKRQARMS